MSCALNQILNTHWAITEDYLRLMLSIAARHLDFELIEKIRSEEDNDVHCEAIQGSKREWRLVDPNAAALQIIA